MIKKKKLTTKLVRSLQDHLKGLLENVSESFTTVIVDIPTEDLKVENWLEEKEEISVTLKMTGAELIVDDTPLVVRVSRLWSREEIYH